MQLLLYSTCLDVLASTAQSYHTNVADLQPVDPLCSHSGPQGVVDKGDTDTAGG